MLNPLLWWRFFLLGSQLRPIQQLQSILLYNPLRCNPIRIIPHKHVCEVGSIMDFLNGRLAIVKLRNWGDHRLKAGFMKVGESESLAGIEADLVRGGW